jgi:hypothetical protein
MKTIQRHWQHRVHKTRDEDNPETLATGLSSSLVLCTLCCQCLWIVFIPCLVYPMLPVSLDCLHPLSCVPYVASVSGLSSSLVLGTQDKGCRQSRNTRNIGYTRQGMKTIQRHWQHRVHKTRDEDNPETIVFIPCLVYPMLPVSLDCLHPFSCVPYVVSVSGLSSSLVLCTLWWGQSRMDNPEKLATLGTQDTGRRQTKQGAIKNRRSRDTGNIGYTRHGTKTNKTRSIKNGQSRETDNIGILCLVYPMLPVSLDRLFLIAPCFVCLRPVSCVPNVASFSGLSILN